MKLSTVFKTLVISMMLMLTISCSQSTEPEFQPLNISHKTSPFSDTLLDEPSIVTINGSQYIQYRSYYHYSITPVTPNIKPLIEKIDSLKHEINELKKQLNK